MPDFIVGQAGEIAVIPRMVAHRVRSENEHLRVCWIPLHPLCGDEKCGGSVAPIQLSEQFGKPIRIAASIESKCDLSVPTRATR
jgi:hypothetical protein